MNSLIGLLCWGVMVANGETPAPDIDSIEKQVLEYRRSIQRGHIVFKQKTFKNTIYESHFDRVTTIWFDGKKLRNDDLLRYTDEPKDTPLHREVKCRNCEKNGYWVDYIDKKSPQGELAVSMTDMTANPLPEVFNLIHPRCLGMAPESFPNLTASRAHLESYVARSDRRNTSIQRVSWKDRECVQISYQLPTDADYADNAHVRIWISLHQGPSVVCIEAEADVHGKHYADTVESDLRQFMPSGLWYPQAVVYERLIDGKSVEKEVTEVQLLALNEPVPLEIFTLAGMELPVDKPVSVVDKKEGRLLYWNGEKLVPKSSRRPSALRPPSLFARQHWLLVANAVLFALLAILLFWRWWRRRKPAGEN
jgi:hypothetical protein